MNNLMRRVLLRRSVYSFSDRIPDDEDLLAILEEGKMLSNADTNQVWHFTAVQNKDVIRSMYKLAMKSVEKYEEQHKHWRAEVDMLLNMPMLLVISGCDVKYAEDAAAALFGSMMLAAEKHGLSSSWLDIPVEILSDDSAVLRDILQIPGDYVPMCVGAFGYKQAHSGAVVTKVDSIINIIR